MFTSNRIQFILPLIYEIENSGIAVSIAEELSCILVKRYVVNESSNDYVYQTIKKAIREITPDISYEKESNILDVLLATVRLHAQ